MTGDEPFLDAKQEIAAVTCVPDAQTAPSSHTQEQPCKQVKIALTALGYHECIFELRPRAAPLAGVAPTAPFGWIDRPPSVNRLIGLAWLANVFHGDRFPFDIRAETLTFYKLLYHVSLDEPELETLIAWADGKPPARQR